MKEKNQGVLLKNERVYKINFLKNERVCVEKCRFYSRSIYAQYDLHEKAADSIWKIMRKSNVQEERKYKSLY